jgi:hypothetical protein
MSKKATKTTTTIPTPATSVPTSAAPQPAISAGPGKPAIPPELVELLRLEQEAIDADVPVEEALTAVEIENLREYRENPPVQFDEAAHPEKQTPADSVMAEAVVALEELWAYYTSDQYRIPCQEVQEIFRLAGYGKSEREPFEPLPETPWQKEHREEVRAAAGSLASLPDPSPNPTLEQQVAEARGPVTDPDKFWDLQRFIASGSFTVRAVEAQLGRMISIGVIATKDTWQTKDRWCAAQRAHDKLKDPVLLAGFWRSIVFQRGRMTGHVQIEAKMAASYAILDTLGEMFNEK